MQMNIHVMNAVIKDLGMIWMDVKRAVLHCVKAVDMYLLFLNKRMMEGSLGNMPRPSVDRVMMSMVTQFMKLILYKRFNKNHE